MQGAYKKHGDVDHKFACAYSFSLFSPARSFFAPLSSSNPAPRYCGRKSLHVLNFAPSHLTPFLEFRLHVTLQQRSSQYLSGVHLSMLWHFP